ncbi:MAG: DNA polymerase, partial [Lachnospiraceae bacterium]|nr:DNA polymerase [Lachnospiraceae bacterium]
GQVLFEKMLLPGLKKTKTWYSKAADVIEKLAAKQPIVAEILEYRTLSKLKSTYADGLVPYIEEDGRIRTSFKQTVTATGRLSSADPNLQNIPMREELGRLIRKCFYPGEGNLFIDADYSQIELRILAHMSGDEKLIDAYRQSEDIHRITASQVFHVPLEDVTDQMRRNAKAVNFGIVYGISSFGLSQGLSITRKEAEEYINGYFETYPRIKAFLDHLVLSAKENGYAVSLFGRRRPIPELRSANFMQRSFGERAAMNSPIQGTAADIMKIAMIRVSKRLKEELPEADLILQIHDELLVEVPSGKAEEARRIIKEEMEGAVSLKVDLVTDSNIGADWYDAK